MTELTIDIKQPVSFDHFENIIVGALEGGSNYWYELNVAEFRNTLKGEKGEPISTRIAQSLYEDPTFKMNVYDIEEEGELLGTVTQESILNAIKTANEKHSDVFYDLFEGSWDANTADVLFQLATMGEIVFG